MEATEISNGAKLAAISVATSISSFPLDDVTQVGQIASIIVSIVSGIAALVKMFKRKK